MDLENTWFRAYRMNVSWTGWIVVVGTSLFESYNQIPDLAWMDEIT